MLEITTVGPTWRRMCLSPPAPLRSRAHGADASARAILRKKLRRDQVLAFFSQLQRCVDMEACGGARY